MTDPEPYCAQCGNLTRNHIWLCPDGTYENPKTQAVIEAARALTSHPPMLPNTPNSGIPQWLAERETLHAALRKAVSAYDGETP